MQVLAFLVICLVAVAIGPPAQATRDSIYAETNSLAGPAVGIDAPDFAITLAKDATLCWSPSQNKVFLIEEGLVTYGAGCLVDAGDLDFDTVATEKGQADGRRTTSRSGGAREPADEVTGTIVSSPIRHPLRC